MVLGDFIPKVGEVPNHRKVKVLGVPGVNDNCESGWVVYWKRACNKNSYFVKIKGDKLLTGYLNSSAEQVGASHSKLILKFFSKAPGY